MLYYMGVARLPSKRDYWANSNPYIPIHPIAREMDMTQDQFMFLWQNCHRDQNDESDNKCGEEEKSEGDASEPNKEETSE
eukprot:235374-Ditylum_brightwellii.AAC.1